MDFHSRSFRQHVSHAENQHSEYNSRNRNSKSNQNSYYTEIRNSTTSIDFCKYFSISGRCKNGDKCRFRHEIIRINENEPKKKFQVSCCDATSKNDGSIEIFMASKNKDLTRWIIKNDEQTGKPKIIYDQNINFKETITCCVYYKVCLFCALKNGKIIVLFETGQQLILNGHETAVYSLVFVDDILISGDWSGQIRMWEFNSQANTFNCVKVLEAQFKIACMKELTFTSEENNLNIRYLWIGGPKIVILDLSNLNFIKDINFNNQICMNLINFQDHMIAGFAAGNIILYTYDGIEKNNHEGPFLSCIEGMIVKNEPIILHGTHKGHIEFLKLPSFEELGTFWANKMHIGLKRIINLGQNHFLTFREDGQISIWKWLE